MRAPRIACLAVAIAATLHIGAGDAMAQGEATVTYYKVVISDDAGQTGWNGDFIRMSAPAINEFGDLVFEADTNAADERGRGVWFGDFNGAAYTVTKIAQEGDEFVQTLPGFDGTVQVELTLDTPLDPATSQGAIGFSLPIIDNAGRVAFIGSIVSPDAEQGESVLFRTDASQTPFAIAGAPFRKTPIITDDGSQFQHRWFNVDAQNPSPSLRDYRFRAHLAMPRDGDGTLAWYSNLDTIDPMDTSNLPPFAEDEDAKDREGGLFYGQSFNDHEDIVRYEDPVSGIDGVQYGDLSSLNRNLFSAPSMNASGDAAFVARTSDGGVVMTVFNKDEEPSVEQMRVVIYDGAQLPGIDPEHKAALNEIASPAFNQMGAVAFSAFAKNELVLPHLKHGIWAEDNSLVLQKVVFLDDPVPSFPSAQWKSFGPPVLNAEFSKAFSGRHEREINGETVSTHGIYRASSLNDIEPVAESGLFTPLVPNTTLQGRKAGIFEFFDDALMNDTGNVAFLAEVDITDSTLQSNLDGLAINPALIEEEGVFFQDNDDVLRTIVATGMKMNDLFNNDDQRVIINLRFSDNVHAQNSGHQDGRRTAITNTLMTIDDDPPSQLARVAFTAVLATPGDPDPDNFDEGVFLAELLVTETTPPPPPPPPGDECTDCLSRLCIAPECDFNGTLLGEGPDYNQNGTVDDYDVNIMMMAWGYDGGRCDLNEDGIVDVLDLEILMQDYGKMVK